MVERNVSMNRLHTLIDGFPQVRILCIGDVMLDKFLYGSVTRISPEAPVPIMRMDRETRMLGGAGNVVSNLCALGCRTTFVSVVGDDANGRQVKAFLEDTCCTPELVECRDYETTVKIRFVAGKHHLLRADQEQELKMAPELAARFLERVDACLPDADLVLLSDYGKGLFDGETAPAVIARCRAAGKPVIVDPKGADYSRYGGATLVKPNMKEFQEAPEVCLNPSAPGWEKATLEGAARLFDEFGIENLLVTLSEHGMIFIPSSNPADFVCIPTEAREVFDVSGAGDTSLASLGAALAAGATVPEALVVSNVAAGIVVGKFGTASVTGGELKEALEEKARKVSSWHHRNNILTAEAAAELAERFRKEKKVVGFTNGCFDLLHLGHLHSFMKAREACDVLFVGLNTDASIKRLKGENRPVNNEELRSLLLASLDFIDYVVLFDEDTALPLIEKLRPDVIAKEGYPLERWPEGQYVVSYGGRAVELPRLEGFSSTDIINRMKKRPE